MFHLTDQQLDLVTLPDLSTIDLVYDPVTGQPTSIDDPEGSATTTIPLSCTRWRYAGLRVAESCHFSFFWVKFISSFSGPRCHVGASPIRPDSFTL